MGCTGWQAFGKLVGTPESNSDKGGSECKIPQWPERSKPCKHVDGNLLFCVLHEVPFSTWKLLHHAVAQLLTDLDSKTMRALQAQMRNCSKLKSSGAWSWRASWHQAKIKVGLGQKRSKGDFQKGPRKQTTACIPRETWYNTLHFDHVRNSPRLSRNVWTIEKAWRAWSLKLQCEKAFTNLSNESNNQGNTVPEVVVLVEINSTSPRWKASALIYDCGTSIYVKVSHCWIWMCLMPFSIHFGANEPKPIRTELQNSTLQQRANLLPFSWCNNEMHLLLQRPFFSMKAVFTAWMLVVCIVWEDRCVCVHVFVFEREVLGLQQSWFLCPPHYWQPTSHCFTCEEFSFYMWFVVVVAAAGGGGVVWLPAGGLLSNVAKYRPQTGRLLQLQKWKTIEDQSVYKKL